VDIPPHNRLVFLPELSFKEYINRDNRLLGIKIIPSAGLEEPEEIIIHEPPPEPEPAPAPRPEPPVLSEYQFKPVLEPQPEPEPEPVAEPVQKRRRIHWIIPLVIGVVAILCVVFYFRNFYPGRQEKVSSQQSAVSSQRSEVDSQQSAVNSQQAAVSSQQSAVGSQQSAVSSQQSAVGSQQSADSGQSSEPDTQHSTLNPQHLTLNTVTASRHLFQLAREVYGNPFLWVLIYKENQDKISDPDMVVSESELKIPKLEGSAKHLSKNDSLEVSEGYRLVSEFYKTKGDPRAAEFARAMEKYRPR
jgi:hypothetical protein